MTETESKQSLHKYCVFYSNESTDHKWGNKVKAEPSSSGDLPPSIRPEVQLSDVAVWKSFKRVFLIDAQQVDNTNFPEQFRSNRENTQLLGEDSIFFQQERARELARVICPLIKQTVKETKKTFELALVGAGFAGMTFARELIKNFGKRNIHGTQTQILKITIFEHHGELLPRFFRASGRFVYRFHHLAGPDEDLKSDYSVPATGVSLPWNEGGLGPQIRTMRKKLLQNIKRYCELRLHRKVSRLDFTNYDTDKTISLNASLSSNGETIDQGDNFNFSFNAVVLALGGPREARPYWVAPVRASLDPSALAPYRFAVIGTGNTAASEIFNLKLEDRNFSIFLDKLKEAKGKLIKGLRKTKSQGDPNVSIYADNNFALEDFLKLIGKLSSEKGCKKDQECLKAKTCQLVPSKLCEPKGAICALISEMRKFKNIIVPENFVRVTIIAQEKKLNPRLNEYPDDVIAFNAMNPINKFLIYLLIATGHIDLLRIPDKGLSEDGKKIRPHFHTSQDIKGLDESDVSKTKLEYTLGDSTAREQIKSDDDDGLWYQVLNCINPTRTYFNVFKEVESVSSPDTTGGGGETPPLNKILQNKIKELRP